MKKLLAFGGAVVVELGRPGTTGVIVVVGGLNIFATENGAVLLKVVVVVGCGNRFVPVFGCGPNWNCVDAFAFAVVA